MGRSRIARGKGIKVDRRKRAEESRKVNAHLTPQERIERLDKLGFRALKEREKLNKLIG